MVEKDKITEEKVKRSGIFDFKDTYQFAYRWLRDEDYDVEEKKYIEDVGADSKKVEIKWEATKKITDYFKIELKLDWRVLGLVNVEVEKDGKKIKTNKGGFELKISGTLIRDYQSSWDRNPMYKFLRGIYDKYIILGTVKKYEMKVFTEVETLAEEIKAFLTIEGMKWFLKMNAKSLGFKDKRKINLNGRINKTPK